MYYNSKYLYWMCISTESELHESNQLSVQKKPNCIDQYCMVCLIQPPLRPWHEPPPKGKNKKKSRDRKSTRKSTPFCSSNDIELMCDRFLNATFPNSSLLFGCLWHWCFSHIESSTGCQATGDDIDDEKAQLSVRSGMLSAARMHNIGFVRCGMIV